MDCLGTMHLWCSHIWGAGRSCHIFSDSIVFKKHIYCSYLWMVGVFQVKNVVNVCGRPKCMTRYTMSKTYYLWYKWMVQILNSGSIENDVKVLKTYEELKGFIEAFTVRQKEPCIQTMVTDTQTKSCIPAESWIKIVQWLDAFITLDQYVFFKPEGDEWY